MSRHATYPMHFGIRKVTRRVVLVGQHGATLVTTSATRTTRVQGCRHSVDWGDVHLIVSKSCS